jgi:hypothetical protein
MGFFSGLKSAISKTWNAGKKLVKKVVEVVKKVTEKTVEVVSTVIKKTAKVITDVARPISKKVKKVWNGVTGKEKFEEAEALLKSIEEKYNKKKYSYERAMNLLLKDLEKNISKINYHKTEIYDKHFKKFTDLANKLHNLTIEGKNFLEYFDSSVTEIKHSHGVRAKKDLYLIDFNNLSFKDVSLGVLTLGFFTRKKAKQTLIKVKEEEIRIDEEIVKMDSQLKKIKVVLNSIQNVSTYFDQLVLSYSKLLNRFEYGIKTQTQKMLLLGLELNSGKIDFKLMPIAHIEEFQALFNLSIVLKQMSTMGYLNNKGSVIQKDIKAINNIKKKDKEIGLLVA